MQTAVYAAWSPDSTKLLILLQTATPGLYSAQLWTTPGKFIRSYYETMPALGAMWSPDGKTLASVTPANDLILSNAANSNTDSGTAIASKRSGISSGYAWAPDGKKFVAGYTDGFAGWFSAAGTLLTEIAADTTTPGGLAWSPDGRYLATGDTPPGGPANGDPSQAPLPAGHVLVYDMSAKLIAVLNDAIPPLAWSPDGKQLITWSATGEAIHVWVVKP